MKATRCLHKGQFLQGNLGKGRIASTDFAPSWHENNTYQYASKLWPLYSTTFKNTARSGDGTLTGTPTTRNFTRYFNAAGPSIMPMPDGTTPNAQQLRKSWSIDLPKAQEDLEAPEYTPSASAMAVTMAIGPLLKVHIKAGDLRSAEADAVVSNCYGNLSPVDVASAALLDASGAEMIAEAESHNRLFGPIPKGFVGITGAYALTAKKVIHCVPPMWKDGHYNEERWLSCLYHNLLTECRFHDLKSVAVHGSVCNWPVELSCTVLVHALSDWAECEQKHPGAAELNVTIYVDNADEAATFADTWKRVS
ncbi:O-acetyl-ADP-ribose deacetylase [Diplonema papillatum]|nr:O-acetyl-ADP-ribose deacetylase [Diplonema papillatum]